MKVLISGGGTGGHIFPAIAIADALKQEDTATQVLFVGAKGKMEMEKVPQAGYTIKALNIAGLQRNKIASNLSLPFKMGISFFQAIGILLQFKPDVVVGVGGYASFMMCRVAQLRGIPTLLLEQNAFAGKTNCILSKRAKCICTAFDKVKNLSVNASSKIVKTGNPIRQSITDNPYKRLQSKQDFHLPENQITLLIIGGSQGALNINKAIRHLLPFFKEHHIQLIWQTGKYFYSQALEASQHYTNVQVFAFVDDMAKVYTAADIIVSRSGAIALAELCVIGKPTIFIPLPTAAENHQYYNAKVLVDNDAALLVEEKHIGTLQSMILSLIQDKDKCETLSRNMVKQAIANADKKIVEQIIKLKNNCR